VSHQFPVLVVVAVTVVGVVVEVDVETVATVVVVVGVIGTVATVVGVEAVVVVLVAHDTKTIDTTTRQVNRIQIAPFFIRTSFYFSNTVLYKNRY